MDSKRIVLVTSLLLSASFLHAQTNSSAVPQAIAESPNSYLGDVAAGCDSKSAAGGVACAAGGSPNQGAPAISQSGSVPPPLTAQQLMKFRETPTYGVSQLKADPCINGPCWKGAESIDLRESRKHEETDLDLFERGAKGIGVDVFIEKGIKGKWLGIAGAEAAKEGLEWVESPGISALKVIPKVGKLIGRGSSAALGVFFEGEMTASPDVDELPIAIRKEQDARQAAMRKQAREREFGTTAAKNEAAAAQDAAAQAANIQAQPVSSPVAGPSPFDQILTAINAQVSANAAARNDASTSSGVCTNLDPKTGCHVGHNEQSHPGGCKKC